MSNPGVGRTGQAACQSRPTATDAQSASLFYGSVRGRIAALMLRGRLAEFWPAGSLAGQTVLGLGYASPYLRPWREGGGRCISLNPAQAGLVPLLPAAWPTGAPSLSCTAEEQALPFADLSFDRIVLVHGLEAADHARRLLREVWRVLKDDGRLLVVAPNRRGLWAHAESTPFGQGQPYSPGQLGRLLAQSLFRVERRGTALFVPPVRTRLILRGAPIWEDAGRRIAPQFGGVIISEAVKDVYAGLPRRAEPRRRLVLAEAA